MGHLSDQLTARDTNGIAAIVDDLTNYIVKNHGPERVYWFGSSLSGKMNMSSDIDMAVLFFDKQHLVKARSDIVRYADKFSIPVDISFFLLDHFMKKKDLGGLMYVISQTGNLVYDKDLSL